MTHPIRQGDVYLIPARLPATLTELPRDAGRIVLAYGEVTGHAHVITSPDATLLTDAENRRFLRLVSSVALTHEEHGTITIERPAPGWGYQQVPQREYDGEAERVVAD